VDQLFVAIDQWSVTGGQSSVIYVSRNTSHAPQACSGLNGPRENSVNISNQTTWQASSSRRQDWAFSRSRMQDNLERQMGHRTQVGPLPQDQSNHVQVGLLPRN